MWQQPGSKAAITARSVSDFGLVCLVEEPGDKKPDWKNSGVTPWQEHRLTISPDGSVNEVKSGYSFFRQQQAWQQWVARFSLAGRFLQTE